MTTTQQVLSTLTFKIAQLKTQIAKTPPPPFGPWFGDGPSRRMLTIECEALEELAQAIELSQGQTVVHAFWGRCSPSAPHDVARYVGILRTYQAQAAAGLACLLQPYLGLVNELIETLSAPKAA